MAKHLGCTLALKNQFYLCKEPALIPRQDGRYRRLRSLEMLCRFGRHALPYRAALCCNLSLWPLGHICGFQEKVRNQNRKWQLWKGRSCPFALGDRSLAYS